MSIIFPLLKCPLNGHTHLLGAFSREEAETLVAKAESQGFELQTSRGAAYGASDHWQILDLWDLFVFCLLENHWILNIEMCVLVIFACFLWVRRVAARNLTSFLLSFVIPKGLANRRLPSSTGLRWGGTAPLSPKLRRRRLCLWAVAKPALSASVESWRSGTRGAQWEYPHLQIHWCLVDISGCFEECFCVWEDHKWGFPKIGLLPNHPS